MKSLLKISAFFIFSLCLLSEQLLANHAVIGGTLKYVHILGNQYQVEAALYRDCSGDAAPLTITVYITSVQCGITDSVILDPYIGTGQEVSPLCPAPTTCNGGTELGIQRWEYKNQYAFPGQCDDWLMFTSIDSRSAAFTTIQNPTGSPIYLECRLNNLIGDNSSPQNNIDPYLLLCMNQPRAFNPGMIDADGDSLFYELIPARTDANTNVIYNGTYSALQPITSSPIASLNSATGDLSITPMALETGDMVYRVLEYRSGVLIGSIMFEAMINTAQCPSPPEMNPPLGLYNFSVLPGPFCFDVNCYSFDTSDILTMTYNQQIPGATFVVTGLSQTEGTFCWNPDSSNVRPQPYTFTITVRDNNCPIQGIHIFSFSIFVSFDSAAATRFSEMTYFSGRTYYDLNQDGNQDSSEVNLPGQKVNITPDSIYLFTGLDGYFIFSTSNNGPQTLTIEPLTDWHLTTGPLSYTILDDSLFHSGLNFGLAPDSIYNSLEVHIANVVPRCNNNVPYYLNYFNAGTTIADGRVLFIPDPSTSFFSSYPPPDLVAGDTLIYNFTDLWPFQFGHIQVILSLPGAGTQLNFNSSVELDSAGNFYELYNESLQQVVSCSYDPNDKAVIPEGLYSDHRVLSSGPLQYTIRFQNTGNDTAFTVFVQDYIDPSLDIQSLHVVGSSHATTTIIFPDRMVEFRFENILLPDSNVDEPGSNGFIQYEITPLQNLSLPVIVENEASIFFDSNAPVVTNNVWNTLVSDLTVGMNPNQSDQEMIIVKPNPFHLTAEIILSKSFINVESQFSIIDVTGRILERRMVNASSIILSGEKLRSGIYFFELINSDDRRVTGKFIID